MREFDKRTIKFYDEMRDYILSAGKDYSHAEVVGVGSLVEGYEVNSKLLNYSLYLIKSLQNDGLDNIYSEIFAKKSGFNRPYLDMIFQYVNNDGKPYENSEYMTISKKGFNGIFQKTDKPNLFLPIESLISVMVKVPHGIVDEQGEEIISESTKEKVLVKPGSAFLMPYSYGDDFENHLNEFMPDDINSSAFHIDPNTEKFKVCDEFGTFKDDNVRELFNQDDEIYLGDPLDRFN